MDAAHRRTGAVHACQPGIASSQQIGKALRRLGLVTREDDNGVDVYTCGHSPLAALLQVAPAAQPQLLVRPPNSLALSLLGSNCCYAAGRPAADVAA